MNEQQKKDYEIEKMLWDHPRVPFPSAEELMAYAAASGLPENVMVKSIVKNWNYERLTGFERGQMDRVVEADGMGKV